MCSLREHAENRQGFARCCTAYEHKMWHTALSYDAHQLAAVDVRCLGCGAGVAKTTPAAAVRAVLRQAEIRYRGRLIDSWYSRGTASQTLLAPTGNASRAPCVRRGVIVPQDCGSCGRWWPLGGWRSAVRPSLEPRRSFVTNCGVCAAIFGPVQSNSNRAGVSGGREPRWRRFWCPVVIVGRMVCPRGV